MAVLIFEQFTYLHVPLLRFPLSSPGICTLNMQDDKVHCGGSSCGPWFYSGLARTLTPSKVCVPYHPLRVLISMSIFALRVSLLDEYVSAGADCLSAVICSVAHTSRTNQIKIQLEWKVCGIFGTSLMDLWGVARTQICYMESWSPQNKSAKLTRKTF